MKHKRNTLAPILLAPAVLALGHLGEQPSFAPEEGATLTKRARTESELSLDEMKMNMGGQEIDSSAMGMEMTSAVTQVVTVTDSYVSVGEGRPLKLKRSYDELSSQTEVSVSGPMGDQDSDISGSSELEGTSVVFSWDDDAEEYEAAFDEDSDGDEDLLEGLLEDMDMRGLLPDGDVSEGDVWDVDPGQLRGIFSPGGKVKIEPEDVDFSMGGAPSSNMNEMMEEFEGEVTAKFVGVREDDEARVAVIELTIDVSSANDLTEFMEEMMENMEMPEGMEIEVMADAFDMEFLFEGKGEVLWNLGTGLLHSLEISGDVSQVMDTTMNMNMAGQEQTIEQSMSFAGSQVITIETEG
jgi:hypothetical protein